jgi:DNA primase
MSATDEIKARTNIVELIGGYTPLKRAGRNHKGLCPFHTERTPSFVVFPDSQTWRCFGACGEGGDIFSFLMKKENMDFPEALRLLADRAGVELEAFSGAQAENKETRDRLRGLMTDAAHFFHQRLISSADAEFAREYARGRGLVWETLEKFEIGYAPDSWDATSHTLINLGYTEQELIDTGMVILRDEGGTYDRFRNRFIIPIRDLKGQVVGFGARGLSPDATPKYLNSPQSVLFDKSHLLFALDQARQQIRQDETAVIVEGYMDAIAAHQAGFTNVIAQMGTAFTETQLKLLSRYANKLILALDPDAAGQMATERGREVIERVSKAAAQEIINDGRWDFDRAEQETRGTISAEFDTRGMLHYEGKLGFDIRVIVLPAGKDPDVLIRENPQAWADLVASAIPIVEHALQTAIQGLDLNNPKAKSAVAEKVVPIINEISNPVERGHYVQRLARLLKIEERILFPSGQPTTAPRRAQRQAQAAPASDLRPLLEEHLNATQWREVFSLAALIQNPRLIYRINRVLSECMAPLAVEGLPPPDSLSLEITPSDFAQPEHRQIFAAWRAALDQDETDPMAYMAFHLDEITLQRLHTWLEQPLDALERAILPPGKEHTDEQIFEEAVQALLDLRRKRLDAYIQELQFLIGDLENGGDAQAIQQYSATIQALLSARNRLGQAHHRNGLAGRKGRTSAAQAHVQDR